MKSLHANVTGFTSSNNGTFTGLGGQFITYDAVGNRIGAKAFEGLQTATSISASHRRVADLLYTHFVTHGSVTNEEQRYLYDDQNRLTRVETPTAVAISTRAYDAYGNVTEYRDWVSKDRQAMTYDGDGRLLTQDNYVNHSTLQSQIRYNLAGTYTGDITGNDWERLFDNGQIADANLPSYDKAGNLIHFTVYVPGTNAYTHHYVYEYKRGDSYLETRQVVTVQLHYTGQSPGGTGATQTQYDAWGNTALVVGNFASGGGYRGFLYNHNGQVVMQYRATNQEVQTYHYAGTTPLGSHTDHLDADFDYNYTPISDVYPDRTAGSYTVQKNDTLQAIALKVWGDASLWYVIADANGIRSNSDLYAGRQLKLPNQVTNAHNTNETYRPYNAGEIIGSTTPKAPEPPPAVVPPRSGGKRGGCGFIAQIIMIVVIVIVTIYTAGAAAALFAPAGTVIGATGVAVGTASTFATGVAALSGGLVAAAGGAVTLGVAAAAAGAALVGGAIGSIAGQLAGKAMGIVDDFSWKAVAIGGLSAAAGSGIGSGLGRLAAGSGSVVGQASGRMGAVTRGVIGGAAGSTVNQGLNIWLGDQESFSWGGVAAGAIVGGISAGFGYNADNSAANMVGQKFDPLKVVGDTLKQTAVDYSRQYIAMAIDGKGKPDFARILGDSFGNAIGNAIVGEMVWREIPKDIRELSPAHANLYQFAKNDLGLSADDAAAYVRRNDVDSLLRLQNEIAGTKAKYGVSFDDLGEEQQLEVLRSFYPKGSGEWSSVEGDFVPGASAPVNLPLDEYSSSRDVTRKQLVEASVGVLYTGAEALDALFKHVPDGLAQTAVGATQILLGGVPKFLVNKALDLTVGPQLQAMKDQHLVDPLSRQIAIYGLGANNAAEVEHFGILSNPLANFAVDSVFGSARGVISNARNIASGPYAKVQGPLQPGQGANYGELKAQRRKFGETEALDIDHQPSFAAQVRAREEAFGRRLTPTERASLKASTPAIASPRLLHQQTSPTYGGRNTPSRIAEDAANLNAAAIRDRAIFEEAMKKR